MPIALDGREGGKEKAIGIKVGPGIEEGEYRENGDEDGTGDKELCFRLRNSLSRAASITCSATSSMIHSSDFWTRFANKVLPRLGLTKIELNEKMELKIKNTKRVKKTKANE